MPCSSMGERFLDMEKVVGSLPTKATKIIDGDRESYFVIGTQFNLKLNLWGSNPRHSF
jgi:hypothetical protein